MKVEYSKNYNKGRIEWNKLIPKEFKNNPIEYFNSPDYEKNISYDTIRKTFKIIKNKIRYNT